MPPRNGTATGPTAGRRRACRSKRRRRPATRRAEPSPSEMGLERARVAPEARLELDRDLAGIAHRPLRAIEGARHIGEALREIGAARAFVTGRVARDAAQLLA